MKYDPQTGDSELTVKFVPGGTCAVFSCPATSGTREEFFEAILQTLKHIWEKWMLESENDVDPGGVAYEFYDERCHYDGPYFMDICITVIKNN